MFGARTRLIALVTITLVTICGAQALAQAEPKKTTRSEEAAKLSSSGSLKAKTTASEGSNPGAAQADYPNDSAPSELVRRQVGENVVSPSEYAVPASDNAVPALIRGRELFKVRGRVGRSNAEQRVAGLTVALDEVIDADSFKPANLSVKNRGEQAAIAYGDKILISITSEDAQAAGLPPASVAQNWLVSIKNTIETERYQRNLHEAINQVKIGTVKDNILYILANPLSLRIGISLFGLLILVVVTYSIRRSIPRYFHESYKRYTISKITEFSAYFLGLVFLSVVFSDTLGNLAVILGAATAGIALALKELIVSMAGWLAISFGDTYRVGDRVQISGVKGDVIDVGLVRTTLMELGEWVQGDLYTGRIVRVANGNVFAGATYNYSRDLPFLWDEIVVKITTESDVMQARQIFHSIVSDAVDGYVSDAKLAWERLKEKYLVEDETIDPLITMVIQDNKYEFTLRYPVDYRQRRIVRDQIFSSIVSELGKTEGAVKLA